VTRQLPRPGSSLAAFQRLAMRLQRLTDGITQHRSCPAPPALPGSTAGHDQIKAVESDGDISRGTGRLDRRSADHARSGPLHCVAADTTGTVPVPRAGHFQR